MSVYMVDNTEKTGKMTEEVTIGDCTLYNGDAFDILPNLTDGSVDAVISDPPYGITACEWDKVPPLDLMWQLFDAKTKPTANFVCLR